VTTLNDHHGIIHFLIQEEDGRSMEQVSFVALEAAFLSSRFDSPLHEMVNRAELTEIAVETFARTRGSGIPSDGVSGMTVLVDEIAIGQDPTAPERTAECEIVRRIFWLLGAPRDPGFLI
jgi:hypothetical protein